MTKFFIRLLYCFITLATIVQNGVSQDFYEVNKIQEIKLYFTQPNWRQLLNTAAASTAEPYTYCKRVLINGIQFDSIGAKFKGNSTFNAARIKNPWHIELDHYKDQTYQGYKDIKLSNIFADPSCVREALSYNLMQPYVDIPRANFAQVWVNDTLIGLYTNVEAITKSFCKKKFLSGDNNVFVKCNPASPGGSALIGGSSLSYFGNDSSAYNRLYEMNSTYGWKELIDLCDTLNNKTSEIEKILDVDRALWMLAYNVLFVNLDSYTGNFTQNYYLYRDETKRFNSIIWDLNMSFGSFTQVGVGIPSDSLSLAKLNPFVHETNISKPLISKLLSNPRYKKMYIAHLRTMLNEQIKSGFYKTYGESLRATIDNAVKTDPNNLSTYARFLTNFYYGSAGTGPSNPTGIVSLMENKIKYLDTLSVMKLTPPSISQNLFTEANIGSITNITTNVSGHNSSGVYIGYRTQIGGAFKREVMYDDGLHNDGGANDGIFGIGLKMTTTIIEYYIWAENDVAGIFSPQRAEHEYYRIDAKLTPSANIVINEIMASNTKTAKDNKGEYDDWIELYNKSNVAVNIGGWYLSDDLTKPKKWTIPNNTTIPSKGYLVIWADESESQSTSTILHTNFKLSASGESLRLYDKSGAVVDQMVFGNLAADISFARRPNGIGSFIVQAPTFGINNDNNLTSVSDLDKSVSMNIYPNPVLNNTLNINIDSDLKYEVRVFNSLGQIVHIDKVEKETAIDVGNWNSGVYLVKIGNQSRKVVKY
jgi:hypothetical protein